MTTGQSHARLLGDDNGRRFARKTFDRLSNTAQKGYRKTFELQIEHVPIVGQSIYSRSSK